MIMTISQLATRLFARPARQHRLSLPRLLYWMLLLGISLTAILMLAHPAYAASNTPVIQAGVQDQHIRTTPAADCSNQGAGNYNAGQCTPFGIDTFLSLTQSDLTTGNNAIQVLWSFGLD